LIDDNKALCAGLVRIAASIDEEVRRTRSARDEKTVYHTKLREALSFTRSFSSQVSDFAGDILTTSTYEDAIDTLRPVRTQLSLLHKSFSALNSAVSWASQYTTIAWWVSERLLSLGLERYTVVLAPGPIGDFGIATPTASNELRKLSDNGVLSNVERNVRLLALIRVLHVPAPDGSSALWHPLILGHELAHLKYTPFWVESWLAEQQMDSLSDFAKDVITLAQSRAQRRGSEVPSFWYQSLTHWLSEIACDVALAHQYGPEGLASLETHLAINSLSADSPSHPNPSLRLALQRKTTDGELADLSPEIPSQDDSSLRLSAALSFCLKFKQSVTSELESRFSGADEISDSCADAAHNALKDSRTPASQDWPRDALAESPSSIESGLVRALWRRQAELISSSGDDNATTNMAATTNMGANIVRALKDLDRIDHAIDSLQFATRFERRRRKDDTSGSERSQRSQRISNVLWVTRDGVKLDSDQPMGKPTQDLRLGRHFIIFKRNEISGLNTLGERSKMKAMQSTVEVGWGQEFILHPNELVLAVSFETLRVDNDCCAHVLSRSSLGRMGLLSATAVQVQPGYKGCLTLELVNLSSVPLSLTPGQRIAQLVPLASLGDQDGYKGPYQDAGPRPRFWPSPRDWESDVLRGL
jgi:deoxycytidine triphosphate deaminase